MQKLAHSLKKKLIKKMSEWY